MFQLLVMLPLHTGTNLGSDLFRLLKAVQTEIRRGINNLRIILVIVTISKLTSTGTKTTMTHSTNLIRKRLHAKNQLVLRSSTLYNRKRTRRHTFVKIPIRKTSRRKMTEIYRFHRSNQRISRKNFISFNFVLFNFNFNFSHSNKKIK